MSIVSIIARAGLPVPLPTSENIDLRLPAPPAARAPGAHDARRVPPTRCRVKAFQPGPARPDGETKVP